MAVGAFELNVVEVSLPWLARLLETVDGVSALERRRPFSRTPWHLRFCYRGSWLVVCEPFGDNSRYWVGPEAEEVDLSALESVVAAASIPPGRAALVGLLSWPSVKRSCLVLGWVACLFALGLWFAWLCHLLPPTLLGRDRATTLVAMFSARMLATCLSALTAVALFFWNGRRWSAWVWMLLAPALIELIFWLSMLLLTVIDRLGV